MFVNFFANDLFSNNFFKILETASYDVAQNILSFVGGKGGKTQKVKFHYLNTMPFPEKLSLLVLSWLLQSYVVLCSMIQYLQAERSQHT